MCGARQREEKKKGLASTSGRGIISAPLAGAGSGATGVHTAGHGRFKSTGETELAASQRALASAAEYHRLPMVAESEDLDSGEDTLVPASASVPQSLPVAPVVRVGPGTFSSLHSSPIVCHGVVQLASQPH